LENLSPQKRYTDSGPRLAGNQGLPRTAALVAVGAAVTAGQAGPAQGVGHGAVGGWGGITATAIARLGTPGLIAASLIAPGLIAAAVTGLAAAAIAGLRAAALPGPGPPGPVTVGGTR
jgi:hypothetical protein